MRLGRNIATLTAVALMVIGCVAASLARNPQWDDEADSRHAAYLFMEALRQRSLDNDDAHYDLLRQAYRLDPADAPLGFEYASIDVQLAPDSATQSRGFDLVRRNFRANPGDFYSTLTYAMICEHYALTDERIEAWRVIDSLRPNRPSVISQYAQSLMARGDTASLAKALRLVGSIDTLDGASMGLSALKMRIHLMRRDTAAVFSEMLSLIASDPSNPELYLTMSDLQNAYGNSDSVRFYLDRACQVDSAYGRAIYRRAAYLGQIGDSAAFDNEVFRALRLPTLEFEDKLAILHGYVTQLYADSTRQSQIQALFDELVEQHPHEKDLRSLYAGYLIMTGNLSGAAEQKVNQLELDPSDEDDWLIACSLYAQLEKFDTVLRLAREGLGYHPKSSGLNRLIGATLWEMDRYDDAIPYVEEAIKLHNSDNPASLANLYNLLGEIYFRLGNLGEMQKNLEMALKVNPDDISTYNNYAYFLTLLGGDLQKAAAMSRESVMVEPESPTYLDTYAWVLFNQGKLAEAREIIDRAMAANPEQDMMEIYDHAGDIYYYLGDRQRAQELWKTALKIAPTDAKLLNKIKGTPPTAPTVAPSE